MAFQSGRQNQQRFPLPEEKVAELGRLRQLEEENQRLKKRVADLSLDKYILQEVLAKKPEARAPP